MKERLNDVVIENAKIIFRNFSGEKSEYNKFGRREFSVILDQESADAMAEDGWTIRVRPPREDGEEPTYLLRVEAKFENYPPKVVMIAGGVQTILDEDSVGQLDNAEIENVDLIVRPYSWQVQDKSGVKAYLKSMYVTVKLDPLAMKYAMPAVDDTPF